MQPEIHGMERFSVHNLGQRGKLNPNVHSTLDINVQSLIASEKAWVSRRGCTPPPLSSLPEGRR